MTLAKQIGAEAGLTDGLLLDLGKTELSHCIQVQRNLLVTSRAGLTETRIHQQL